MQEYKLLLPVNDNDGKAIDLEPLLAYVLDTFGGYTLGAEQQGAWRDGKGVVYRDTTRSLYVAISAAKAVALAEHIAVALKQKCVYLRHPSGVVTFVYPKGEV